MDHVGPCSHYAKPNPWAHQLVRIFILSSNLELSSPCSRDNNCQFLLDFFTNNQNASNKTIFRLIFITHSKLQNTHVSKTTVRSQWDPGNQWAPSPPEVFLISNWLRLIFIWVWFVWWGIPTAHDVVPLAAMHSSPLPCFAFVIFYKICRAPLVWLRLHTGMDVLLKSISLYLIYVWAQFVDNSTDMCHCAHIWALNKILILIDIFKNFE